MPPARSVALLVGALPRAGAVGGRHARRWLNSPRGRPVQGTFRPLVVRLNPALDWCHGGEVERLTAMGIYFLSFCVGDDCDVGHGRVFVRLV